MLVRQLFLAAIFLLEIGKSFYLRAVISGLLSPGLLDDKTLVRELTCSDFQKKTD